MIYENDNFNCTMVIRKNLYICGCCMDNLVKSQLFEKKTINYAESYNEVKNIIIKLEIFYKNVRLYFTNLLRWCLTMKIRNLLTLDVIANITVLT